MHHPSIDGGRTLANTMFASWGAVLSTLARNVYEPTVVVIDEVPYLFAGAPDQPTSGESIVMRRATGWPTCTWRSGRVFIEPALPLIDRDRSQQVLDSIVGQWPESDVGRSSQSFETACPAPSHRRSACAHRGQLLDA